MQRASALEPTLRRLVVDAGSLAEGEEIQLDGIALAREALGVPFPIDPGDHRLTAGAPGHLPWSGDEHAAPGPGTDRVSVPALAPSPAVAIPRELAASAPTAVGPPLGSPEAQRSGATASRVLGFALGGVGVVLGAVGIVEAVAMANDASARDSLCSQGSPCPNLTAYNQAKQDDDAARSSRTVAVITGAAAVATIGLGAFLVFSPPHSSGRMAVRTRPPGRFGLEVHPRVGGEEVRLWVTF